MKIVEITSSPDSKYFLTEGCAIFALVLHRLLRRGEFYIYADGSDLADKWNGSGYEFTHVVLGVDGRLYDVRGPRTIGDLAQQFSKNPDDMRVLGPFGEKEFRRRFVGSSGQKPFFGPTSDTVREATFIIRGSPALFGFPVT